MIMILSSLFLASLLMSPAHAGKEKIEAVLLKKTEATPDGSWNIIVEFEKLPDSATDGLSPFEIKTKLEEHADKMQGEVRKKLTNFRSLWIINALSTTSVNKALIDSLAEDAKILFISEDLKVPVEPPPKPPTPQTTGPQARQGPGKQPDPLAWGVIKIGAVQWWDAGYNGSGVIVGHIDTGADGTHTAIQDSYVGEGGWLNPFDTSITFPKEHYPPSHGTGTLSVIVGKDNGVAPGAKWIACAACSDSTCNDIDSSHAIECGNFMLCPNPKDKCSLKPDVVSNSWGLRSQIKIFDGVIEMWKKAGIIAVKSAGNGGANGCDSITVPGNNEDVITVGGVFDDKEELSDGSAIGPPLTRYSEQEIKSKGIFKPDIVAPGEQIYTAVKNGGWAITGGTSVAAPHVTGAIALILSHPMGKGLNLKQIKKILFDSAIKGVLAKKRTCGNFDDSIIPNHKFGYGRLQLPDPNSKWYPDPSPTTTTAPSCSTTVTTLSFGNVRRIMYHVTLGIICSVL